MTTTVTVIATEPGGYDEPLIYTVNVENPSDMLEVGAAVEAQRSEDFGEDPSAFPVEIHFAFPGDLYPVSDWRT